MTVAWHYHTAITTINIKDSKISVLALTINLPQDAHCQKSFLFYKLLYNNNSHFMAIIQVNFS